MVFLRLGTLTLAMLLAGCSSVTAFFFYPQTVWVSTPADARLHYQDVWLSAADGTQLHSWWIPAQGAVADTGTMVLYLHGNAENISSHSHSIYWLAGQGVSVLALDYRGYGASEGQALLPSVLQDIEAAAAWMRQQHPQRRLVVLGQSIGSALAINFVARAGERYGVQALMLDAPFTGFADVARHALGKSWLGWLIWPLTVLVPGEWDPQTQVGSIALPVLILHSPDDAVVPYAQGQQLFRHWQQRASAAPLCWLDSRGPHVASFAFPELRRAARDFLLHGQCPSPDFS